jgi:hypothetical protein
MLATPTGRKARIGAGLRPEKQSRVFRILCDDVKLRRLATTPDGAGLISAEVRFGARSFPPAAPAEQSNRPTPRDHARPADMVV